MHVTSSLWCLAGSAGSQDKENLEDAVRKQHDLIEKQSEELKSLRRQMEERDSELNKARGSIEELTLKSSAATELKILFEEPWLVQTSHARLKGDVPVDREWNSLCALASECGVGGEQGLVAAGAAVR